MARVSAEDRREQLVTAAVRVIGREGPHRATTRRIAEEAEAPLASLHYTFENKDELFVAVLKHTQKLALESFRERLEPGGGVEQASRALIQLHLDLTVEEPDFMIAQYELLFWAVRTPSARRFAPVTYKGYFDVIDEVLSEAAAGDESKEEIQRLSRYTVAILDGMILQRIALGRQGPDSADVARYAVGALAAAKDSPSDGSKAATNGSNPSARRTSRKS
jgi:AcrR family transcriptional regulator